MMFVLFLYSQVVAWSNFFMLTFQLFSFYKEFLLEKCFDYIILGISNR